MSISIQDKAVVQQIIEGQLVAHSDGIIRLPNGLVNETATGEAYITVLPSGSHAVLLIKWMGKGRNMRGVLYYDGKPRLTTDSQIEVQSIDFALGEKRGCSLPVRVERVGEENWYFVSYCID